jgi:hypothetical protein
MRFDRVSGAPASPISHALPDFEALVRAHGDWLAFLATILQREGIVSNDELARALSEFASLTVIDRPEEGRILAFWAAYLQDTSVALRDIPSVH